MRLPANVDIKSRDGTLDRDTVLVNLGPDRTNHERVIKRPGMARTDLYAPAGQGFGAFVFNDFIYVWTDQTPADYPAVYDYVPDYWYVGWGGGSGGMYWENDQQIVEVPEDVFEEIEIGDTITITGALPAGYNGTCLVVADKKTAAQMGVGKGDSILITNLSNPGEVVQGGVAKKLRKCSDRPAFPYAEPPFYGSTLDTYVDPSTTLYREVIAVVQPDGTCPNGAAFRVTNTTTNLRITNISGAIVKTGTSVGTAYWASSNTGVAPSSIDNVYNNIPVAAGVGTYTIRNGRNQSAGLQCGTSQPAINTQTDTAMTIADSNANYQKAAVYAANKAAWDAMCCP